MPLDYNRRQNLMGSVETLGDEDSFGRANYQTSLTRDSADEMNKEIYRPASYAKAVGYKRERSYLKKSDGEFVKFARPRKN
jgi:hypothetical protein